MLRLGSVVIGLIALVQPLTSATPTYPRPFSWSSTEALLAFGDSYTYVQGQLGRQNSTFISDILNPYYTPEQLLSNRIVPGQISTAEGGPNWVEYLTDCFEGLPAQCNDYAREQKQLWDFAFGGADISVSTLPRHHNYTVMLDEQIASYSAQARPYLPNDPAKTLVAVWIGINDIGDSAVNTSIPSFPEFYSHLQSLIFSSLEPLTRSTGNSSAFHSFLFVNLPPLEVTPINLERLATNQTLQPNATQVKIWNNLLEQGVEKWGREKGVKTMLFDSHAAVIEIIDHAAEYGIHNTTDYCPQYNAPDIATEYQKYGCLPIPEYLWYNTGHLTYHTHEILSGMVRAFLESQSA